jgi:hypothetical protein
LEHDAEELGLPKDRSFSCVLFLIIYKNYKGKAAPLFAALRVVGAASIPTPMTSLAADRAGPWRAILGHDLLCARQAQKSALVRMQNNRKIKMLFSPNSLAQGLVNIDIYYQQNNGISHVMLHIPSAPAHGFSIANRRLGHI